ncbi:MAG: SpoIIE family protein phosphatase, partial [Acidobacteria bacterium]|nr:SpoIIE family protein phosphatase [Acidobacteriota bacterium]
GILKLGQFEILGKSTSVSYLGGDYFDYFVLNDRFAVVLIGDVTGHGVPAALLMAMAKSAVKIRSAEEATNVIATLEKLNAHLFETIKRKRLMTMIYSTLDTQNSRITLGNAGHCYPYFFTAMDDRIKQIESPAFPLGARKKGRFGEVSLTLCAGDALIFYTDGLVESVRSNGLPV